MLSPEQESNLLYAAVSILRSVTTQGVLLRGHISKAEKIVKEYDAAQASEVSNG